MVKQMGKNFLGLDGLKHFWSKAKSWIVDRITYEVTAKIAEIVANAPEDLDTLKEISDWIKNHANDASAMNSAILANTKAISGKADKGHTHTKSDITDFPTSLKNPNTLTVNGKTYDGSSAVNAGVQTVANGGTGVTTQAEINKAFIGNLDIDESDVTDGTEFVSSCASNNGFSEPGYVNTPYKRKFSTVWCYIKGKISSVLGLTKDSYGGKASTAGTADVAKSLVYRGDITDTDTFQEVMNKDGKWRVTDLVPSWIGSLYSFYVGGSQSGLMFRIRGGYADIRNIEVNYSIDSNRFVGPWNPLITPTGTLTWNGYIYSYDKSVGDTFGIGLSNTKYVVPNKRVPV